MVFSSIIFLFMFFPITFLLYYAFSFSRKIQNIILLVMSLIFYAWGEPVNVSILIASIIINSTLGYLVNDKAGRSIKFRKTALIIDVVLNLAVLFVFKYLGFVSGIFSGLMGGRAIDIALPIGISFFTFQALSYVIDVYNGKVNPDNPFNVGLYISFFPQLIAGPIIQYSDISEMIRGRKSSLDKISVGISRFAVGVIKKVLLANTMATIADYIFNWSAVGTDKLTVPALMAWLGSISYTLQIYYDFSAYSDMAIGLALCFGFKFSENFNYPYYAKSINDFWKRWHISLTNWFREYVYFPLGGSRVESKDIMVRNLFIVWLLTGIWHGANWTFIMWGIFYFIIQLAERFFGYVEKIRYDWVKRLYTLLIVNFGWVLFRADDLYQAGAFMANMFGANNNGFIDDTTIMFIREYWFFYLAAIIFAVPIVRDVNEFLYKYPDKMVSKIASVGYPIVMGALFILAVSYLMSGSYNPFIYFNF